jgi:hypothetical protein
MEINLKRHHKDTIFLSYLSFIAAVLFCTFFQASKDLTWLSSAAPFLEGLYSVVGIFSVQVAFGVGY